MVNLTSLVQRTDAIRKRLERAGLSRVAAEIQALLRPSIRLNAGQPSSEPVTRLGGVPNMPANIQWPARRDGQPHSFLGQIDLALLQSFDVLPLPAEGSLLFFCDAVFLPCGSDTGDVDGFKVIYSSAPLSDSTPRTPPRDLDSEYIFDGFSLEPALDLTAPGQSVREIERLHLSGSESDAYAQLFDAEGTTHRIGGYPDLVQSDGLELTAERVSRKRYGAEWTVKGGGLEAAAADWRLLFQLDSQQDAGMMWSDAGRLFFMLREQDLRALNFERAWMDVQGG